MKVVEEPLRGGGDELTGMHVLGKGAVRRAQGTSVVAEAWKDAPCAPARRRIDREPRGKRQRALFQPLDAQQLIAEWLQ